MLRVRWATLVDFGSLDETYHTVGIQVRRGWWRRKFVSGGALGQVRRVEDVMCSEQVQQDGVGGDRAQGWMCIVPHC